MQVRRLEAGKSFTVVVGEPAAAVEALRKTEEKEK